MTKATDTQEQIVETIDNYVEQGQACTVDELLNMRDKLAQLSYRFAEMVADLKANYNKSYFIRKITILKRTQGLVANSGYSKVKATILAETEGEPLFKKELDGEAEAHKGDLLLKQINKNLDAMQQRISHLKQEQEREHGFGGINPLIAKLLEYLEQKEKERFEYERQLEQNRQSDELPW